MTVSLALLYGYFFHGGAPLVKAVKSDLSLVTIQILLAKKSLPHPAFKVAHLAAGGIFLS